ncbi:MAG: nucleotidyltransferase family protein [Thermodesulfovibrionia bacterium]
MTTLKEIKEILEKHKEEVSREYKVNEIGIFGSFVRGKQKKRSDIDILVKFDELPDIFKYIDLEDYLRKILRRKVDLIRKEAIRPELKKRILKETIYV